MGLVKDMLSTVPYMMEWMMKAIGDSFIHSLFIEGLLRTIFRPVIGKVMEKFQPGAIVLQCGADSLSGITHPWSFSYHVR